MTQTLFRPVFIVVIQPYESEADNEYVIRGNSVVMKCEIPSYVADFVQVDLWMDSDENMFYPNSEQNYGISTLFPGFSILKSKTVPSLWFMYLLFST